MFSVILCTCPITEAEQIARTLVEQKLVACVNVSNVSSYFIWEGEFQNDIEALMIMKTSSQKVTEVIQQIKKLHSYEVPEVIALPVSEGNEDYLNWVMNSIK